MVNVVCLKWGTKFGPEYVNRLFAGIKRNSTVPFKFHCFTEDSTYLYPEIIVQDLPNFDLEGWWNKLYLFSDELPIPKGETILFTDLDTLITRNVDDFLVHRTHKITVLQDWYWGLAKTASTMNSALMSWVHGSYGFIWDEFMKDPQKEIEILAQHGWGDQHYIEKMVAEKDRNYWQTFYPNKAVSYKVSCLDGLPEEAAIVCYHGAPSIPESITTSGKSWKYYWKPAPWVLDYWQD